MRPRHRLAPRRPPRLVHAWRKGSPSFASRIALTIPAPPHGCHRSLPVPSIRLASLRLPLRSGESTARSRRALAGPSASSNAGPGLLSPAPSHGPCRHQHIRPRRHPIASASRAPTLFSRADSPPHLGPEPRVPVPDCVFDDRTSSSRRTAPHGSACLFAVAARPNTGMICPRVRLERAIALSASRLMGIIDIDRGHAGSPPARPPRNRHAAHPANVHPTRSPFHRPGCRQHSCPGRPDQRRVIVILA